jgi:hypothetical protein
MAQKGCFANGDDDDDYDNGEEEEEEEKEENEVTDVFKMKKFDSPK